MANMRHSDDEQPDPDDLIREGYAREATLLRRADEAKAEADALRQQLEGAVEDAERLGRALRAVLDKHGDECGVCVEAEQAS